MRFTGLLLGATAIMATLTSSYAEDIAPEKVVPSTIPADAKRVYLVDISITHIPDGKAWVLNADNLNMMGTIEMGFLGTLYAPPNHRDGVIHHTRAAAEADDEHFDGKTTE